MGIANLFRNQLSAVIQWQADKQQYLWYKYPTKTDEIKNASKLIVGPGQGAVLVYEGKVVDVLTEEGTFNLKTDNHPFFTTLVNLRQNFESEHKLHIYFYRKAQVTNQQWGTSSPVKFIDEQYNLPVEMGANGTFSYQISDVEHFFKDIVGARTEVSNSEIRDLILGRLSQNIVTTIHKLGYSYNQIDGHRTWPRASHPTPRRDTEPGLHPHRLPRRRNALRRANARANRPNCRCNGRLAGCTGGRTYLRRTGKTTCLARCRT